MELRKFDTKSPQEEGAFLHLRHPKYGHLLYTGEGVDAEGKLVDEDKPADPIGLKIRGIESPSVQAFVKKLQRSNLKAGARSARALDDLDYETGLDFGTVLIIDFVNIDDGGKPLEPTKENKRKFLQLSDDLVRQVVEFARERDHFFEELSSA